MPDSPSFLDRPELVTERLRLRCPVRRDVAAIVGIVGDPTVACRLARVPHPYGPADAMFFLDRVVPGEWVWAITMHGRDELVGVVGLTPDERAGTGELGYWLSQDRWGRGIMTEAARAAVAFGFDDLGLPYLQSSYFVENRASGRVLEKLGFAETGRAMRPCLAAGRDVPSVEMRLLSPGRA